MDSKKNSLKDLGKRLVYSAVSLFVITMMLLFVYDPFFKWIFFLFIATISVFAIWEYGQIAKVKEIIIPKGVLEVGSFLITFSFFMSTLYPEYRLIPLLVLFLLITSVFVIHFKEINQSLVDISVSSFGFIYISVPLGLLLLLIYLPDKISFQDGRWWVIYLLAVTKSADVGAYFFGRCFGKHKLAPKISPNKTIEGALGGLIIAIGVSIGFSFFLYDNDLAFELQRAIALGVIIGIMGQVGDLAESLIKRDAKVKDSNSLPGLGGVLDMVDSLLFTIPILYLYLNRA